jgi:hypothetical protein
MTIPVVSKEVINSIYHQVNRDQQKESSIYINQMFADVHNENPNLFQAVVDSVISLSEKCDLDPYGVVSLNCIHIAICVYQSIKQQLICDSLNE